MPKDQQASKVVITPNNNWIFLYKPYSNDMVTVYNLVVNSFVTTIQASLPPKLTTEKQIDSPNKKITFIIDPNGEEIRIYDVRNKQFLPALHAPVGEKINEIEFSKDGMLAFLYCYPQGSHQVIVYDISRQKQLDSIYVPNGEKIVWVSAARKSFHMDLINCEDVCIGSYNLMHRKFEAAKFRLKSRKPSISQVVTTPDNRLVFLVHCKFSDMMRVAVYDTLSQKLLGLVRLHTGLMIEDIGITPNGRLAFLYDSHYLSGVYLKEIPIYDLLLQKQLEPMRPDQLLIRVIQEKKGEDVIDDVIGIMELRINEIVITPDSRLIFLYDKKGGSQVAVYDVLSNQLLLPIKMPEGEKVSEVVVTPDSNLAFLYNKKGSRQITMYDCQAKRRFLLTYKFDEPINGIRFVKNSRECIFFSDYNCYIASFPQPPLLFHQAKEEVQDVEFLENGDLWIQCLNSGYHSWGWKNPELRKKLLIEKSVGHSASVLKTIKLSVSLVLTMSKRETYICEVQGIRLVAINSLPYQVSVHTTADNSLAFFSYRYEGGREVMVYDVISQKFFAPIQLSRDENDYSERAVDIPKAFRI